jgi:hypothetical protein
VEEIGKGERRFLFLGLDQPQFSGKTVRTPLVVDSIQCRKYIPSDRKSDAT